MAENTPLNIDREALVRAIGSQRIQANAEWCVLCGASASAAPELPRILEQEISKNPELIKPLARAEFVHDLATRLSSSDTNADWCVLCGASSSTAPVMERVLPRLSDAEIDAIAGRLLPRLKG